MSIVNKVSGKISGKFSEWKNRLSRLKLNHAPYSVWTNPIHFIACGFGVGVIPVMPGTFGSLAAIPFIILAGRLPLIGYLIVTLFVCAVSAWSTGVADRDFAEHDHPATVSDEYAGMFVTMIALPLNATTLFIGFLLFRIFDIWKPLVIGWVDKNVSGGFGVVLDDVLAGALACVILHALLIFHVIAV